jgi:type III secretory pathway component EscV
MTNKLDPLRGMVKEVKVQEALNGKFLGIQRMKEEIEVMRAEVEVLVKELRRVVKIALVSSRPNIHHLIIRNNVTRRMKKTVTMLKPVPMMLEWPQQPQTNPTVGEEIIQ